jgi:hypothetical protein
VSALVVASDEEKGLRIKDLVTIQEHDAFEGEVATINVIAEEQVRGR